MKPPPSKRARWLDTALRAQQAKTLDHRYRVHETQAAQEVAALRESQALHSLRALAASWRKGRDTALLAKDLDHLYQRFHAQLNDDAVDAAQASSAHQQALDEALNQLRQSHALQQALSRTVEHRDRRIAKAAQVQERGVANEAWVLAQAGKKGSE